MTCTCRWFLARDLWLGPDKAHRVEQVKVIKPLVTIMTTVEIYFIPIDGCGVIVPAGWLLAKSLRLTAADQVVKVKDVEVIESFLTVPASKDVQVVGHFVAGVGCSATRWIVLRDRCEPRHAFSKFLTNIQIKTY